MRWLSISTGGTTLVTALLIGCTVDFFSVEARSTPLSPFFLKNDVNRFASATAISSMVPRGGASSLTASRSLHSNRSAEAVLSEDGKKSMQNSIAKKKTGCLRGGDRPFTTLIPKGKEGFFLSLLLSVVYLVLLLSNSLKPDCDYSSQGFCVFGFDPSKQECTKGMNSHAFSWWVDLIFTALVIGVGKWTEAPTNLIVALAAVVLSHGLLHKVFDYTSCKLGVASNTSPTTLFFANVIYFVFTALVCSVGLSLNDTPKIPSKNLIALGIAAATSYLSQPKKNNGISPIFMTTQLLVSILGLTDKEDKCQTSWAIYSCSLVL